MSKKDWHLFLINNCYSISRLVQGPGLGFAFMSSAPALVCVAHNPLCFKNELAKGRSASW